MINLDVITTETQQREGYEIEVRVLYDHDVTPEGDGDWATPEQIEAWRNDEWFYVGVQVRALFFGAELAESSLWGIPYGGDMGINILETAKEIENWEEFREQILTRREHLADELQKVSA